MQMQIKFWTESLTTQNQNYFVTGKKTGYHLK
jgi:hypothetical protein